MSFLFKTKEEKLAALIKKRNQVDAQIQEVYHSITERRSKTQRQILKKRHQKLTARLFAIERKIDELMGRKPLTDEEVRKALDKPTTYFKE